MHENEWGASQALKQSASARPRARRAAHAGALRTASDTLQSTHVTLSHCLHLPIYRIFSRCVIYLYPYLQHELLNSDLEQNVLQFHSLKLSPSILFQTQNAIF